MGFVVFNDGAHFCRKLWAYVDDVEVCTARCGPEEPPPEEWETPPDWPPVTCWYWKRGWPDYAPNGMPDFDQRGYYTDTLTMTVDGPAAAANSYRASPTPPSVTS